MIPKPTKIMLATLLLSLSISPKAHCNPVPISGPGREVLPITMKKENGISIVDEDLTIYDDWKARIVESEPPLVSSQAMKKLQEPKIPGELDIYGELPCVHYNARYRFNNKTGKAKLIEIGFPVPISKENVVMLPVAPTSMKVSYDGKQIKLNRFEKTTPMLYLKSIFTLSQANLLIRTGIAKAVTECPDYLLLSGLGNNLEEARISLTQCKEISKVQREKILKRLEDYSPSSGQFPANQTIVWYAFSIELPRGLSKELQVSYNCSVGRFSEYNFSYILSTGSFWGKDMENLRVTINLDRAFLKKRRTL